MGNPSTPDDRCLHELPHFQCAICMKHPDARKPMKGLSGPPLGTASAGETESHATRFERPAPRVHGNKGHADTDRNIGHARDDSN